MTEEGQPAAVTRYVTSHDGTLLAATTDGDGPRLPIVNVLPWATPGRMAPVGESTLGGLARHRRVVSYARRGTGASARDVDEVGLEAQVADLAAVADVLAPGVFDLFALFDATPIAIAYAARVPERVRKLVLWQPFVDGSDWIPADRVRGLVDLAGTDWSLALRTLASMWVPRGPTETQRTFARAFREQFAPDIFVKSLLAVQATEVADEARRVRAETLILHPNAAGLPVRHAQGVASLIPNAILQSIDQESSFISDERARAIILRFLDGDGAAPPPARDGAAGMAIILFTDIVDSTALTERMGDAAFRDASRALDAGLRTAIRDAGGKAIDGKLLGDGVLATFASAAQAIDAARRCRALSAASELRLHMGLHAGDVIREENNVFGGAVNIAARISGLSAPGEVLVSRTVADLARTSAGVAFEDRGEHALKGIEEPVRVYTVRWPDG
jgi:class 3 adenylate cyclase